MCGVLKSVLRFISGDLVNEVPHATGHRLREIKWGVGLVKGQFPHNGGFGETRIRCGFRQHFIHHKAQTIKITAEGEQVSFGAFRR